jgi:hypothetical protein
MSVRFLAPVLFIMVAACAEAAPLPASVEQFFKEGIRLSPASPAIIRGADDTGPQQVQLLKGQHYRFDLAAPFGPATLKIEDQRGALMYSTPPPRGSFVAPADGVYRVAVDRPAGASGKFHLVVTQEALAVLRDPPDVRSVGPGGLALTSNLTNEDAIDKVRNHRAKTFKVRLGAGKTYVIDMMSMQFDCFLRLEDPTGKQIAFNDDGGEGLNSRLAIRVPADGVYRVICTSFSGEIGAFELRMRETPK